MKQKRYLLPLLICVLFLFLLLLVAVVHREGLLPMTCKDLSACLGLKAAPPPDTPPPDPDTIPDAPITISDPVTTTITVENEPAKDEEPTYVFITGTFDTMPEQIRTIQFGHTFLEKPAVFTNSYFNGYPSIAQPYNITTTSFKLSNNFWNHTNASPYVKGVWVAIGKASSADLSSELADVFYAKVDANDPNPKGIYSYTTNPFILFNCFKTPWSSIAQFVKEPTAQSTYQVLYAINNTDASKEAKVNWVALPPAPKLTRFNANRVVETGSFGDSETEHTIIFAKPFSKVPVVIISCFEKEGFEKALTGQLKTITDKQFTFTVRSCSDNQDVNKQTSGCWVAFSQTN